MPATPRTSAWPPSLPSVPTSRATRVTSAANERELVHHRVDGVLQLEDFALHVDRDLLATGRRWPRPWSRRRCCAPGDVRLPAIKLTLSVRSFHVPATPRTSAWPPSLPSVPTSRATRVTSAANERELVHHRVDGVLQLEDLALHVDGDLLRQVAVGDGRRHGGDVADLAGQVAGHASSRSRSGPSTCRRRPSRRPGRRACLRCPLRGPRGSLPTRSC